jgi:outer membrane lipoprotein-sorting protein
MSSSNRSTALRTFVWASLATLATLAACSKENKPSEQAKGSAAAPAAAAPAPAEALPANATPEERIIAQARAAIGPEVKLEAVNGVLLTGKIFDDKNAEVGSVVLLFQKPGKQHTELRSPKQTLIQGSDGMVGWIMSVDPSTNSKKLTILKAPDELTNLYTTMENLYFYRAADRVKGSIVRYEGDVDYRGAKCHKVSFQYPNSVTYVRYFDAATGKLRGTVMLPNGNEIVEAGSTNVNGVDFPSVLNNYSKDGKLTQVVKFDKINLNPTIDPKAKIFDLPDMVALAKAAAAGTAAPKPAATTAAGSGAAQPSQAKPPGSSAGYPTPQSLMKKN